jgi:hypothetical protein
MFDSAERDYTASWVSSTSSIPPEHKVNPDSESPSAYEFKSWSNELVRNQKFLPRNLLIIHSLSCLFLRALVLSISSSNCKLFPEAMPAEIVVPESFGQRLEKEKGKSMRHPDSSEWYNREMNEERAKKLTWGAPLANSNSANQ